jgi:tRNA modification GTPase
MTPLEIICLTPPGRGAVASFLLSGNNARETFLLHWRGKEPVRERPTWGRLQLTASGDCEEAVVHCTADEGVEIHVHGGEQVASAIETLFTQTGAVCAGRAVKKTWQEHFAPGTSQRDLALRLLPYAPTERTVQILLDQYHGAYEREMAAMEQLSCEVERQQRLARLQELVPLGKHLVEPFRVVLAGASNAGKSSLLNAILGFQRSLVHAVPGTTRDVVSGQTALEGFPVTFFDTAGFRSTDDELERQGMDRSLGSIADADLVVWVVDLTVDEAKRPPCPASPNVLICCNKRDSERINGYETATDFAGLPVSARTGEGIERLLGKVIRCLVPSPPKPGEAVRLIPAPTL